MDLLCFCFVLCLQCLCSRLFICALCSPAGKELTYWLSFVVSYCEFCHFPIGILGQVWYLIVSIPYLCNLTYFYHSVKINIINVLNIVQMSGCSVKSINNISLLIIRKRHHKLLLYQNRN